MSAIERGRNALTLKRTALSSCSLHAILGRRLGSGSSSNKALFWLLDGGFLAIWLPLRGVVCRSLCLQHLRLFYIGGQAQVDLGPVVLHGGICIAITLKMFSVWSIQNFLHFWRCLAVFVNFFRRLMSEASSVVVYILRQWDWAAVNLWVERVFRERPYKFERHGQLTPECKCSGK